MERLNSFLNTALICALCVAATYIYCSQECGCDAKWKAQEALNKQLVRHVEQSGGRIDTGHPAPIGSAKP